MRGVRSGTVSLSLATYFALCVYGRVCARACLPTAKERNGLYVLLPRDLNGKTIVMTNIGHGESCPGIKPTVATAVLLNAR